MSAELIGKYLLIGVTYLDSNSTVTKQLQTHGKIISIDDKAGIVIKKADGSGNYTIPPGIDNLYPAAPGEYRIRSTGEVVINPDYVSTWTVNEPNKN